MRSRWFTALLVGVEAVGILAVGVAAAAICYRHNWRVDLSLGRQYSLSPLARAIIEKLDKPVKITAFVREEDPRLPAQLDLLRRVSIASPLISYRVVELTRNPALASEYGVEFYGTIVVESQGRRRKVTNADESLLLGALVSVSRSKRKKIYFVTGHGEKLLESSDRERGMSFLRRALGAKVYDLAEIRFLVPNGVPGDASLVVMAGPEKDLLPGEGKALVDYVRGGGAALILLDPLRLPRIEGALERLGIRALHNLVVDPSSRLARGESITFEVEGLDSGHPIVSAMKAGPVFSAARSLETLEDMPGMETFVLLEASKSAWVREFPPGEKKVGEGQARERTAGPVVIGAGTVVRGGPAGRPGRLVVYGDSDFASDRFSEYLGSKDLFLNSVDWLAGEPWLMVAAPRFKRAGVEVFYVKASQQLILFWLSTVVEPLVFLIVGTGIFIYRRRSR